MVRLTVSALRHRKYECDKPVRVQQYRKYINSKQWKKKKKQLIRSWKCKVCGRRRNLNVHHLHYHNLGVEKKNDLVVLCFRCHSLWHQEKILLKNSPSIKRLRNIVRADEMERELDDRLDFLLS